ncbi:MAG: UvrD-helicase domain-containing protein [Synergistaceae bacterium]|nr:UvrD-helicase domain-containing protein [Synergistaceae bacterium]
MKYLLPPETPKGQREAVNAGEKVITVEAGAGTGKTWVLSQRYLRLLIDNPEILPQDILTLTYTEAAAEEMKERIQSLILKELARFDDEERKREIEDGLSDLWISTIHSFSSRLIRESGLQLDIDPSASVISEKQKQDFWEDIKNAAEFAALRNLADAYGDKRLKDIACELDSSEYFSAAVSKWKSSSLSAFAERVSELHASSGLTWENMLDWADDSRLIDKTRPLIEKILLPEWRNEWDIWQAMTLPKAKKTNKAGLELESLLERYRTDNADDETKIKFYDELIVDSEGKITGNAGEPFKTIKAELGKTLGDWRKDKTQIVKDITHGYIKGFSDEELKMRRVLMKFCALSWGMWSMMKQKIGLLSFSDMISHAKSIIESKGVNREFKHILVDEFQDTDPLQFDMIKSLSDKSQDTGLFAVGDPKQSIYKFRHAEPSLFVDMISNADKEVNLDTSFRTRESLLNRINNLFASIWPNGIGSSELMQKLTFKPLRPAENKPERDSGTMPEFRIILSRKEDSKADNAREKLADVLAREIAKYVHEGFTIWDKEEKVIRPVKFSDFAILSRSRSCFDILEDALSRYGIKSVQDKSDDFFGRGEINDIVCMLRAAADMNDSFALTGWLMSPFSGVKEEDAVKSFLELLGTNKEQRPSDILKVKLPDAYSRLQRLSLIGELEGPAGLLYLYDRNRKWLSCYAPNDRLRVLRNFRHAISLASEFQRSGTSGLIACGEWLTRAERNELSVEEPAWHDKDENAVRLGAVHSAKGLEYPVTVIFEHRTGKNSDHDSLRPSKNLGLVFGDMPDEITKGKEIKSQGITWEKLLSEQGDSEEETRLFYVAATRAQDSLIFCGLVKAKDNSAYKDTWTDLMLSNVKDIEPEFTDEFDDSGEKISFADEANESKRVLEVVNVKNSLRQISATSFSLFEFCPFAWRRSYKQGLNLEWEYDSQNEDDNDDYDSGGADLGSLAHWVLSQWPKGDDYESELDTLLNDRRTFERLPVKLRGAWRDVKGKRNLQNWLMNFSRTELFSRLRNENVRREFIFRLKLNDSTALAGAIDAFYGNNLIDYKITRFDSVPPGLYESQLDFYALAMHDLFSCESVNMSVIFLREGIISERTCDNFDEIRERVIHAAELCASGPYNANINHCGMCPFKKGCIKCE